MNLQERLDAIARRRSEASGSFRYSPSSEEAIGAANIAWLLELEATVFRPLFLAVADVFTSGVLTLSSRVDLIYDAARLESTAAYGPDRIVFVAEVPRSGGGSITVSVKSRPVQVCAIDRGRSFSDLRAACESAMLRQIETEM